MAFMVAAIPYITMAIGAVSAIQQGRQAKASADYNAKQQEVSADITRRQASEREQMQRNEARKMLGKQRAAIAESGVGFGGSSQDIYLESARDAELDALNLRYAGELEARGLIEQAKLTRMEGRAKAQQAGFQAVGSVLGGVAKGYGK
jgi:hypothetical protein